MSYPPTPEEVEAWLCAHPKEVAALIACLCAIVRLKDPELGLSMDLLVQSLQKGKP